MEGKDLLKMFHKQITQKVKYIFSKTKKKKMKFKMEKKIYLFSLLNYKEKII